MENDDSQLIIDGQGKMYLLETAKWAKFLAIMAFVFLGLGVLMSMAMILIPAMMPETGNIRMMFLGKWGVLLYGIFLLVVIAIAIIPYYYLFQFAVCTQAAVVSNDEMIMTESLEWLKKHFKFIGIMTIVVVCIYVLAIIMFAIGRMASA